MRDRTRPVRLLLALMQSIVISGVLLHAGEYFGCHCVREAGGLVAAFQGPDVHAGVPQGRAGDDQRERPNTWSARTSAGRTFAGTWSAVVDPKTGTVTGTWTLVDAKGRPVTRGGWSAAKSPTGWTGAWRATVAGSKTEYSGTWNAGATLEPDAGFADLFKAAVQTVVSGKWRSGGQSGAWSIQVFE